MRNYRAVTLDIFLLKIGEKITALSDKLQKTPARMVIVLVNLEMLCKMVDSVGQKGDLYLRRPSVGFVNS